MNRTFERDQTARPLGVIETLSAGYETVNRRLWLLLFPIALDALFWLGPKVSIVGLAGYVPLNTLGSQQVVDMTDMLAHFNLIFLLALYVPTVLGKAPFIAISPELRGLAPQPVYQLVPRDLVVSLALILALSLVVAAFYLGGIGQLVRGEVAAGNWLRVWAHYCWRLIVLHALGVAAFTALAVPWALAIVVGWALNAELGGFLLLLFQVAMLWAAFYFFFALDAVILTDASPMRAALSSVQIIRANFWSAVALIGLIVLIESGLPVVWRALSGQPIGLVASILGNAYIGTGLAAASMLYYRDRLRLLRGSLIGTN